MALISTTMAQSHKTAAPMIAGDMTDALMTREEGNTNVRDGTIMGRSTPAAPDETVRLSGRNGTAAESWMNTAVL